MQKVPSCLMWILMFVMSTSPSIALAAPRVELELVTERGFPLTGAQQWLESLSYVGASGIRIREARPGDVGSVTNRGSEQSPSYHVVGVLTAQNTLRLPGGTFTLSDRAGITKWITKLQSGGEEALTARTGAFGLTSKQLVSIHDELAARVTTTTRGKRTGEVVQSIVQSLPREVAIDPAARQVLLGEDAVAEEMLGVSSGTALAAALRPLGLVLTLKGSPGGDVRLLITDARGAEQSWPVGWPAEKAPRELVPDLFKFLNVEIHDTPLADALAAVQQRLNIPFLFDHNSLARHRIDPATRNVSLPKGNNYYKKIIDQMLAPHLKSEIRVDEADQPFLWISTVKR